MLKGATSLSKFQAANVSFRAGAPSPWEHVAWGSTHFLGRLAPALPGVARLGDLAARAADLQGSISGGNAYLGRRSPKNISGPCSPAVMSGQPTPEKVLSIVTRQRDADLSHTQIAPVSSSNQGWLDPQSRGRGAAGIRLLRGDTQWYSPFGKPCGRTVNLCAPMARHPTLGYLPKGKKS